MADAAVWITGTGPDKQLNFRLPTGGKGDKGDKGNDGSNVLPTDTAIRDAINNSASATRGALKSNFMPKWQANTAYVANDKVLSPNGDVLSAKINFTSGATYNPADWDKPLDAAYIGLVQAAKNPDLLVAGAITLDGSDQITSAAVVWPDGTPGTMTITARHTTGAITAYNITYGSPATKTFTQPTITRNTNGAATLVPQIVVS